MSDTLALIAALIWIIAALFWIWEWRRARAMLKPLVEQMQQAIRDSEAARLGLSAAQRGAVGALCPRCAKTNFIEIEVLGSLRYCVYCGAPLVAR